jgi:hypothetical protein
VTGIGHPDGRPGARVDVVSICSFPAGALLWEAQPGQLSLTVIVKATFVLAPGEMTLAIEQDPLREERHWDDNGMASVHFPGDYAPSKRKVDVTLVGHAYAPQREPATSIVARLAVGDLEKSVRVTGDRSWTLGPDKTPEPGPPSPFLRMPLRYERAGLSADNPIGIDVHAPQVVSMPALPNLERASGRGGTPCFGPVAPTWRARRKLLDEPATFWAYGIVRDPRAAGPPLGPAPPRLDFAFFNAAPADQQVDLLRPGTSVELDHLHPTHARLTTRLPSIRPQVFRIPPPDAPRPRVEEIILRCDSLWIDTDRAVIVLTWRGLADVGGPSEDVGRIVVAADPEGKKLRWDRVEKRLAEHSSTMRLGPDGQVPPQEPEPAPPPDPLSRRHDAVKGGPAEPSPRSSSDAGILDAPTNPLEARRGSVAEAEPVEVEIEDDETNSLPEPRASEPARLPEPPSRRAPLGAPPPKPPGPPPSLPRPPRAPARTVGLALRKDLTVQRYAEISAALSQKGAQRAAVLRGHMLTEAAWTLVEQTWKKTMAAEAEQGERALADAFDEAYVAHQERLQRPIDLASYARLQVAVERGAVGQVLADLDLELGDLVRLQRVWARRAEASPELAAKLSHAVEEARRAGSPG